MQFNLNLVIITQRFTDYRNGITAVTIE